VVFLALVVIVGSAPANGQDEALEETPAEVSLAAPTRHRFDIGLEHLGFSSSSIETLSLSYNWVPLSHHSFFATFNYLDSDFGDAVESGISDTLLLYSWVPGEKLSAKPWVPDRLGIGAGILLPTGKAELETSLDMYVGLLYAGTVVRVSRRVALLPGISYYASFSEGDSAIPMNAASADIRFVFSIANHWWVSWGTSVFEDFEIHDTTIASDLQVGREIGSGFSLSLEYGTVEGDLPLITLGAEFDERFAFNLHFEVG
jgi:hypothetical protein